MENKSQKTNEKGQSLVELGLSITIMLVLLAGLVDLGSIFFNYMTMRDAAQEGAAYASVFPKDCSGTDARVRANLRNANPADVEVNVLVNGVACASATDTHACSPHEVEVTVRQPSYDLMMPLIGTVIGKQSIELRATIKNTILRPVCD